MDEIYYRLLHVFFEANQKPYEDIIPFMLDGIRKTFGATFCSLWKVNKSGASNSEFDSVSLYEIVSSRADFDPRKIETFTTPLKNSIFEKAIEYVQLNKEYSYKPSIREEINDKRSLLPCLLGGMEPGHLISIPIPVSNVESSGSRELSAIINIYPANGDDFRKLFSEVIRDQFSLTLMMERYLIKERINSDIMSIYKERGRKDIGSILYPVVDRILKKYMPYEGASIFLHNKMSKKLLLVTSSGITEPDGRSVKKDEVFYYQSEGLTGYVFRRSKSLRIFDLTRLREEYPESRFPDLEYKRKYLDKTESSGKSFLCIPILLPSRPDEFLGVIRFTNRLNYSTGKVDSFSQEDEYFVQHACMLIALYLEREQNERLRSWIWSQTIHEIAAPVIAMRGTANNIVRKGNDMELGKILSQVGSIFDHSNLVIALVKGMRFLWGSKSDVMKSARYQVGSHNLKNEIVQKAIDIAKPIARAEKIRFDRIIISGSYPDLYLDPYAFQQVLYNLLTNAIRYRKKNNPESFSVEIHCKIVSNFEIPVSPESQDQSFFFDRGYLLQVRDFGIGIKDVSESKRIFEEGYRSPGMERFDVQGLGLGLTVVFRILKDFGCFVWVSKLSDPTEFSIFLPYGMSEYKYYDASDWKK